MTTGNNKRAKKILFISGTPRENGNSELLARRCAAETERRGADVTFLPLREFKIEPIRTTIPACLDILSHNRYLKSQVDTSFIEQEMG